MPSQAPSVITSYLVIFDGAVQNLWDALALAAGTIESSLVELQIQADAANGAAFEVGGADVDAAGLFIPAPSGGVPAAALVMRATKGAQLLLSQLYVKGTAGQAVRLLAIPFTG